MTKSELIEVVAQEANLTKGRAEMVINTIFEAMVEALQRGEGIEIRGFGSFTVRQYKSYEGRNPRTGDAVHVAPKRLPFFKVGKDLRLRVNGQRPAPPPRRPESSKPAATSSVSSPKPSVVPDPGMTEDVI
ncbi:HU family DNA-binding protein [Paraliomyxa miuraensis]|uniref:HU family DNA-binding protein n=1 Tax=Paraliomyxa miuraensis TaxID=376150 RepID=UPI002258C707|nr:HU family DNA-binding protein [Paraliomyxa miuraensis]MCX4240262.1 integration host factor subunit beta [Paraliomyxa miuraensis]